MNSLLENYMSKRVGDVKMKKNTTKLGPVITVSRAAGCSVKSLLCDLSTKLNKHQPRHRWDIVSKDVLNISAQRLKMNPDQLKNVFSLEDRNLVDNVIKAFVSNQYKMETKVRNTAVKVIHQLAVEGHKIIIGRGGVMICSDIENSLHIRIDASLEYKLKHVMASKKLKHDEALRYIEDVEKRRSNFRKSVNNRKKTDCMNFDLVINLDRMTQAQVVDIIYETIRVRGMFD